MTPVVNRLRDEYEQVAFFYFNAADNAQGQQLFQQFALPGHPSYIILSETQEEIYRGFGIVPEEELRNAIERQ
jgi:hypothetical protein